MMFDKINFIKLNKQLSKQNEQLSKQNEQLSKQNEQLLWLKEERFRIVNNYLTLLQKCLAGTIYEDPPLKVLGKEAFDSKLREYGWDWPSVAHTMIGEKRLANVRSLAESVIGNDIEGDFIETGVWRGGACILLRAVLSAYCVKNRLVWLADSFEGLPLPDVEKYPFDAGDEFHKFPELSISLEQVKQQY